MESHNHISPKAPTKTPAHIRIYIDFDGTLTFSSGFDTVNNNVFKSMLVPGTGEDYDVAAFKPLEDRVKMLVEAFKNGSKLLMVPGALAFLKHMLGRGAEVIIISRNRQEYINTVLAAQGEIETENKLTTDELKNLTIFDVNDIFALDKARKELAGLSANDKEAIVETVEENRYKADITLGLDDTDTDYYGIVNGFKNNTQINLSPGPAPEPGAYNYAAIEQNILRIETEYNKGHLELPYTEAEGQPAFFVEAKTSRQEINWHPSKSRPGYGRFVSKEEETGKQTKESKEEQLASVPSTMEKGSKEEQTEQTSSVLPKPAPIAKTPHFETATFKAKSLSEQLDVIETELNNKDAKLLPLLKAMERMVLDNNSILQMQQNPDLHIRWSQLYSNGIDLLAQSRFEESLRLYSRISELDLEKLRQGKQAPSIAALTEDFNYTSDLCRLDIVSGSLAENILATERWIRVLGKAVDRNDFPTAFSILAAINSYWVKRLRDIRDSDGDLIEDQFISPAAKAILKKANSLLDYNKNSQKIKKYTGMPTTSYDVDSISTKNLRDNVIPFIGVFKTYFTFANDNIETGEDLSNQAVALIDDPKPAATLAAAEADLAEAIKIKDERRTKAAKSAVESAKKQIQDNKKVVKDLFRRANEALESCKKVSTSCATLLSHWIKQIRQESQKNTNFHQWQNSETSLIDEIIPIMQGMTSDLSDLRDNQKENISRLMNGEISHLKDLEDSVDNSKQNLKEKIDKTPRVVCDRAIEKVALSCLPESFDQTAQDKERLKTAQLQASNSIEFMSAYCDDPKFKTSTEKNKVTSPRTSVVLEQESKRLSVKSKRATSPSPSNSDSEKESNEKRSRTPSPTPEQGSRPLSKVASKEPEVSKKEKFLSRVRGLSLSRKGNANQEMKAQSPVLDMKPVEGKAVDLKEKSQPSEKRGSTPEKKPKFERTYSQRFSNPGSGISLEDVKPLPELPQMTRSNTGLEPPVKREGERKLKQTQSYSVLPKVGNSDNSPRLFVAKKDGASPKFNQPAAAKKGTSEVELKQSDGVSPKSKQAGAAKKPETSAQKGSAKPDVELTLERSDSLKSLPENKKGTSLKS